MNRPYQARLAAMVALLVVAFGGLAYKLVHLQVFQHEKLRAEAQQKIQYTFVREPRRGEIRDVRNNVLAQSIFVKTVCANPLLIAPHKSLVIDWVAPLLEMSPAELEEKLQLRTRTNSEGKLVTNQYVVLKRKVRMETWEQISQVMRTNQVVPDEKKLPSREMIALRGMRNSGIFAETTDDQLRIYPNASVASHLLGYVGMSETETIQGAALETSGKAGLESILDDFLTGIHGVRSTEIVRRHELVAFRDQDMKPHPGRNVTLTLDLGVQHIAETELEEGVRKFNPVSASVIVVRPSTGEIVALANYPTFDPNRPGDAPEAARRNRAITDIYEPGSTFKIVAVAGALNEGVVNLDTRFDTEGGRIYFAGRSLKDDHPGGIMSVEEIIAKSSNIGTFRIAERMGAETMHRYVTNFGFGYRSRIALDGEVAGIVHPVKNWKKISISRIPIGQGIAVTPLQMAMAMSAMANEGRLMAPLLVKRISDENEHVLYNAEPRVIRQIVRPDTARLMVGALKTVVSTNGTARRARLEHYTVAGKTGTAQKPGPGGYMAGKYVASFAGFFPADNPELCILVVLNEPKPDYYGSTTAVPIFHRIAERAAKYLAIKPDVVAPAEPLAVSNVPPRRMTTRANF